MSEPLRLNRTSDTSLGEARQWVRSNREPPGVICPCCDQNASVRYKTLHYSVMKTLLILVRHCRRNSRAAREGVHVENLLDEVGEKSSHDHAILTAWGILEEVPDPSRTDHVKSGVYRVTALGYRFADGEIRMRSRCYTYNKVRRIDRSSEMVTIHDAINNQFDYWSIYEPPDNNA